MAKTKTKRKGETLTLDQVKTLGNELLSSRAHVNNLPVLLSLLSPSSPLDLALESLISLQSFFTPIIPEIPSSFAARSKSLASEEDFDGAESVYKLWLRSRFDEFVNSLIEITVSPLSIEALRDVSLDAIMEFVKLGKEGKFQSAIYHRFIQNIIQATSSVDTLLELMTSKYFKYIDVCYFTYTSIDKIAQRYESASMSDIGGMSLQNNGEMSQSRVDVAAHVIFKILSHIPPLDSEAAYAMLCQFGLSSKKSRRSSKVLVTTEDSPKLEEANEEATSLGHLTKKIKLKFTKAWLSFLKLPLPLDVYKEVLVTLHQNVMPYMANPAILCDFLTRSYDIGGVISVMALSGLFVLMTQHGLEYPKFYEKLYALLTPAIFMAKHRAKFFQLLDTCLKSAYLPAYLAAAFAKKLSRLSLSVPPSGALIIIAIIHNLLRRHPSINFLVHQMVNDESNKDESLNSTEPSESSSISYATQGVDLFNSEETDPAKSGAMRSSLWEIDTLRHHYCPAVSRFVASLENDLTVRAKTTEVTVGDFSSGSYSTIFQQEIRRRVKQVPLAFYKVNPTSLFCESDFPGWTFGKQETGHKENEAINPIEEDGQKTIKRQRVECC
ncbi:U3 small nucleolar RNA-associated protein 19 [Dioscorea alata]|uniref:U3 small nucleolar RNA-associated protein 19 n=1 Tax=Dioscorea alata TaxID=55571 RepID=A0ACB7UV49_DIOAL|nr:U3 small nucleolar RNA-associated protein 19 [Dioscorea alata]